jgi:hypothetical protein
MEENVTGNNTEKSTDKPGFWAVIPATVRYDPSLPMGAKILYSEISALSHQKGYCWASNAYFTTLYGAKDRTISSWISKQRDAGHIIDYNEYFPVTKKIKQRRIRLPIAITNTAKDDAPVTTTPAGPAKNCTTTPTDDPASGADFCTTKPVVVQKSAPPGGAKICGENTINSNTKAAAAEIQKPPDENSAAAAAPFPKNQEPPDPAFKAAFSSLDPSFVFDSRFYPRAAAFLAENGLPGDYVAWLREQCLLKKPASLRGMFCKLFFAQDMAELFKASFKPPPEPVFVSCPACGTHYDSREKRCPACGLENGASPQAVAFAVRLAALPPEKKTEYGERARDIAFSGRDFRETIALLAMLNREFDLPESG